MTQIAILARITLTALQKVVTLTLVVALYCWWSCYDAGSRVGVGGGCAADGEFDDDDGRSGVGHMCHHTYE